MTDLPTAVPSPGTNILVLVTDQHRTDTLGCYGNDAVDTPALDGLAAAGTRFDRAFTPSAICTPARASLVTGVWPARHKLLANFERNVGYIEELDDTFPSFAYPLREAGYRAGHIGKWHVGRERGPKDFGFEGTHFPGWSNPVRHPEYVAWLQERGYPPYAISDEVRPTFPNGQPGNLLSAVLEQPAEATFEAFLADRAIERLREWAAGARDGSAPFYLGVHWFGPHLPYIVPREYHERYRSGTIDLPASMSETFAGKPRVQAEYAAHWGADTLTADQWRELIASYWGYVTLIDEQIGRVLDAVRELGLWDTTAVLFSADHGEFTGSHRLNDKGPAMYDDIYQVPFLARVPGAPPGRAEGRFASFMDIPATVLDLAGVPVPAHYDSRSLLPLIRDDSGVDWPDEIYAEFHGHHFPYPQRMIRTERYKLVVNPSDTNELYDLVADPDELTNRFHDPDPAFAEVRRDLMTRLYEELRRRVDNFYHWMTTMEDVGGKTYDASLSDLDRPRG
ncbi:MAG TPA: sulfatase-like hydrolase/transferase [Thermomicrobiales bacterium]|jgi:arylsulfatase A-like enzyme|nr:sulfatase-like hydrolase/transferase [Thermomicrobiales bacterium]